MATGGCGEVDYLSLPCTNESDNEKANAELENRTLWLGWWLQKSQGKPFYYNNSAVLLPLLSQAIKGKANHYRFNQRAKLWRMTIHSSFHITAKSYLGALNSKAVLSFS